MNNRKIKSYPAYLLLLVWLVLVELGMPPALAQSPAVAVLYPDIREPYRSVFLNIISGIEDGTKEPVKRYTLDKDYAPSVLTAWLERERITSVIALGAQGVAAARELPSGLPIVIGAMLMEPTLKTDRFPGITLTPDPERLFAQLKVLTPGVRRIMVDYNRERSVWLIERAREAAKRHNLALNALPAKDLREAAALYRDALRQLGTADAIWLPQDAATVDEHIIVPLILKEAWDRNLVVFSSNPAHAKRGALFSLYPDNAGMGRSLAALALQQLQNRQDRTPDIVPLRDLLMAVNLRTAERLGLKFSSRERQQFDLIFPSP